MDAKPFILATAGHVDHGKSALVKALTGIDPDRLPEEKSRGITIDLGFAHVTLPVSSGDGPQTIRLGIVDVPGHEDFVKNMVAGVGSVDLALLVVAADDGWMPQTEEHLQILQYLGVERGAVALTKADLVSDEQVAREQIRSKLRGTALAEAPIIATSIPQARGIDELKLAIAEELKNAQPRLDLGKPRLAVDRAFTIKGAGTVVTGTLIGGSLHRGQQIVVQPSGVTARIRAMQSGNSELTPALPGMRVALNLPDLHPRDQSVGSATIGRGDVVTIAGLGTPSDTIDVLIEQSDRADEGRLAHTIANGTPVRLHFGSASVPARFCFQQGGQLVAGQPALAQLRLESPAYLFADDRIILRDSAGRRTIGGGRVLDPCAQRRGFQSAARRASLERLCAARDPASRILAMLADRQVLQREQLLAQSNFSEKSIEDAIAHMASQEMVVAGRSSILEAAWWQGLMKRATDAVDAEHAAHPQRTGLPLPGLRSVIAPHVPAAVDIFDDLLAALKKGGFTQTDAAIGRTAHRPALPAHLQASADQIRAKLSQQAFDPPSRKQLTPDTRAFQALKFLVGTGEIIEISPDLVLLSSQFHQAIEVIAGHLRQHGPSQVSELRQALNTSRRVMVPLLEKLDQQRVTLRQGDKRVLHDAMGK
ncbi:MAG TPA: selenocysteine-specific translation elongation factor [Tepidisphaeraceae bacterium]|nr:selenocysteine-specific translation elongation factor [Tepidisphaeraceae bacterium]